MSNIVVLTQSQQDSTVPNNGYREEEEEEEEEGKEEEREAELIEFDNCSKGLGIKICGGCSRDGREDYGIYIKRILPGGLADIDGNLQQGDQILMVNGESFEGVTNERAVSILRQASATNHVEMVITRDQQAKNEFMEILEKQNGVSFPCTPVPPEFQQSRSTTPACTDGQLRSPTGHSPRASPRPSQLNIQQSPLQSPKTPEEHVLPNGHASNAMLNGEVMYEGNLSPKAMNENVLHGRPPPPQYPQRRTMLPSMSSTPQARVRDQRLHSLSPLSTPSPVHGSLFLPGQDHTVYSTQSLPRPNRSQPVPKTRKLSLDPTVRLRIEKLEVALRYLGLNPTPDQDAALRQRLRVDAAGTVNYGDFVAHAREIFKQELMEKNIDPRAMLFAANDIRDMLDPPSFRPNTQMSSYSHQSDTMDSLRLERDELLMEVQRLKLKLHESDAARLRVEEEMYDIKRKAQVAIDETYSLRKKVHIAERAQKAARTMEHDYEEVVHLLEGEIAKLKMHPGSPTDDVPSQQKIALLNCQLKKSETEKRTYEVATEKLLKFAENVHETFSGQGSRQNLGGLASRGAQRLNPKTVALEAKEIVQAVITLIEKEPLPYGWEEAYTEDGMKYYINHIQQITTWSHPRSGVQQIYDKPQVKATQQPDSKPATQQHDTRAATQQHDGRAVSQSESKAATQQPGSKQRLQPPAKQTTQSNGKQSQQIKQSKDNSAKHS